ncbi:hypothetical protein BD31_I1913 [Candidatus Nitrosopumilus salaria BD31]|uniref:Uncharacterized protein n=1 Tax=Candidatus Nitrosopumilus salarius BD31 TaxID=859350 RepID=I3D2W7_9ARCH|nr:hypothetical protein BD31_I1913 [Candidatus Nitrosopumilus salaria BD31]
MFVHLNKQYSRLRKNIKFTIKMQNDKKLPYQSTELIKM